MYIIELKNLFYKIEDILLRIKGLLFYIYIYIYTYALKYTHMYISQFYYSE